MFEEYKELAKASNWWDSLVKQAAPPRVGRRMNNAPATPPAAPPATPPRVGRRMNNAPATPPNTNKTIFGNFDKEWRAQQQKLNAPAYSIRDRSPIMPKTGLQRSPVKPGTKLDDNYTVPDQLDAEEQARADRYRNMLQSRRSQLPARDVTQQPVKAGEHKCTCGACANCRANAGSKDNMRVQDKNPKKVPVKDFEITGEEAWKGVPNVKTKVKSAAEKTIGFGPELQAQAMRARMDQASAARGAASVDAAARRGAQKHMLSKVPAGKILPDHYSPLGQYVAPTMGAGIGALINLIRGKSVLRGAGTGAFTGMGAGLGFTGGALTGSLGAMEAGMSPNSPSFPHVQRGAGGLGAGAGGVGGYALSQLLFGKEDEKEKKAEELTTPATPPATPPAATAPYSQSQFNTDLNDMRYKGPLAEFRPRPQQSLASEYLSPQGQADRRMTIARSRTKYDPSLSNYSRQAGQWLSNKMGYGKQFAGLGSTWQSLLPALLGAGGLTAGAYGLSHLFGGNDEKRSSANPVFMKSAVNVMDAVKPTAAVAALGALINLVKDKSVLRGAGTGALAGLGGYAGHELGKDIGAGGALNNRVSGPAGSPTAQDVYGLGLRTGIGGTAGAGAGAYGGYELAQHLWGDKDEKADFRLARKRRKTAGWKAKSTKKKKAKTKESAGNNKVAADLLWCASQLVKQSDQPPGQAPVIEGLPDINAIKQQPPAKPFPYNPAPSAADQSIQGWKNIGKGISGAADFASVLGKDLLTNRGRAKPSVLGAFGYANALKGIGDHLGLTTLMSPNPTANIARVGGNYLRGAITGLSGGSINDVKPFEMQNRQWPDGFVQQDASLSPKGWQQLTGFPVSPEQMVNMGDPRLRRLAAQSHNRALEMAPTPQEAAERNQKIDKVDASIF